MGPDCERAVMKNIERRAEGQVVKSDGKTIVGYAAVFGPLSEDLGGFRERVAPAAFNRSLADKAADFRAFVDHDYSKVLGRRSVGTLRLETDKRGLRVEIDTPDTSYAQDLRMLLERGDVSQMSFGFLVRPGGEEWKTDADGARLRTLTDIELIEVSVVTIPAYPDTTAAVRSWRRLEHQRRRAWFYANRFRFQRNVNRKK